MPSFSLVRGTGADTLQRFLPRVTHAQFWSACLFKPAWLLYTTVGSRDCHQRTRQSSVAGARRHRPCRTSNFRHTQGRLRELHFTQVDIACLSQNCCQRACAQRTPNKYSACECARTRWFDVSLSLSVAMRPQHTHRPPEPDGTTQSILLTAFRSVHTLETMVFLQVK